MIILSKHAMLAGFLLLFFCYQSFAQSSQLQKRIHYVSNHNHSQKKAVDKLTKRPSLLVSGGSTQGENSDTRRDPKEIINVTESPVNSTGNDSSMAALDVNQTATENSTAQYDTSAAVPTGSPPQTAVAGTLESTAPTDPPHQTTAVDTSESVAPPSIQRRAMAANTYNAAAPTRSPSQKMVAVPRGVSVLSRSAVGRYLLVLIVLAWDALDVYLPPAHFALLLLSGPLDRVFGGVMRPETGPRLSKTKRRGRRREEESYNRLQLTWAEMMEDVDKYDLVSESFMRRHKLGKFRESGESARDKEEGAIEKSTDWPSKGTSMLSTLKKGVSTAADKATKFPVNVNINLQPSVSKKETVGESIKTSKPRQAESSINASLKEGFSAMTEGLSSASGVLKKGRPGELLRRGLGVGSQKQRSIDELTSAYTDEFSDSEDEGDSDEFDQFVPRKPLKEARRPIGQSSISEQPDLSGTSRRNRPRAPPPLHDHKQPQGTKPKPAGSKKVPSVQGVLGAKALRDHNPPQGTRPKPTGSKKVPSVQDVLGAKVPPSSTKTGKEGTPLPARAKGSEQKLKKQSIRTFMDSQSIDGKQKALKEKNSETGKKHFLDEQKYSSKFPINSSEKPGALPIRPKNLAPGSPINRRSNLSRSQLASRRSGKVKLKERSNQIKEAGSKPRGASKPSLTARSKKIKIRETKKNDSSDDHNK